MQNSNKIKTKETLVSWYASWWFRRFYLLPSSTPYKLLGTWKHLQMHSLGPYLVFKTHLRPHLLSKSLHGPSSAGLATVEHVLNHTSVHCMSSVTSMFPPPQNSSLPTDRVSVHFQGSWESSLPWQSAPEGRLWMKSNDRLPSTSFLRQLVA